MRACMHVKIMYLEHKYMFKIFSNNIIDTCTDRVKLIKFHSLNLSIFKLEK